MNKRIIEVDDLIRRDHHYLLPGDKCYFHGEYTAGEGFAYSETNQLIINFKKEVDRKGRPEWRYKEQAIAKAAQIFRAALSPNAFESVTFVPIPPSKKKTDPLYDDRLLRMLQSMCAGYKSDIRELVIQLESKSPSHDQTTGRPPPDELAENYRIDQSIVNPIPTVALIIDDVLTTGSHFKAVQKVIHAEMPHVQTLGLFIARRVPKSVDFDVWDVN
ncbi:hypothetical protein [Nitrosovibrio sp. Nv4]|uniref:hypothetical protein n=1 Tax=Nitrosovibrio sp. Nv4 TaxID=1945880 RepID=UPI000BC3C548|nr:hypothetical protein [Nitrosovibrio sp. Nv4]SOD42414.1 hypothetical protein SAMN06298226_2753 [Nitrosovibrio sp. Nv4]